VGMIGFAPEKMITSRRWYGTGDGNGVCTRAAVSYLLRLMWFDFLLVPKWIVVGFRAGVYDCVVANSKKILHCYENL
jgi:hypothetical protein